MALLSVFCDEAGQQDMSAGYYLLTLVLHDQSTPLGPYVSDYESHVVQNGLPDIAFHMKDLLHRAGGHQVRARGGVQHVPQVLRPKGRLQAQLPQAGTEEVHLAVAFPRCRFGRCGCRSHHP